MMRSPRLVAIGSCRRDDPERLSPQTVVRFDRETFEQVRALAIRDGVSFSEKVRQLVEWGLETAAEPRP